MKLVREHINETFTEYSDPIRDMGIGSRYLIEKWLKKYGIKKYIINEDLTIDVDDEVDLSNKRIKSLPKYIQFNKVNGSFFAFENPLISLRGYPKITDAWCSCQYTLISILDYMPKKINNIFFCDQCKNLSKKEVIRFVESIKHTNITVVSDYGSYKHSHKL
jgi:hypothetical protein